MEVSQLVIHSNYIKPMKKLLLITFSVCLSLSFLTAQVVTSPPKVQQTYYLDLGGGSILYSLNVENSIRIDKYAKLAFGIGAEYFPKSSEFSGSNNVESLFGSFWVIPSASLLIGKKSNFLELGGAFIAKTRAGIQIIDLSSRIGYRFQPYKGGFFFRIGYTPRISWETEHYAGISVGYTLK